MKNAGVFRSFIHFVMIVFPSMTPSMFYSIPKPCYSLQTTPFPFSHHQQPPILNSSQSLLHPLFPHKPLHSTCFAPPCTDAVHFHQSPRNTHSTCFTTLLTPLTSYIRGISKLVANELVTCNACMYDIYGSAVLCVIMFTTSHIHYCIWRASRLIAGYAFHVYKKWSESCNSSISWQSKAFTKPKPNGVVYSLSTWEIPFIQPLFPLKQYCVCLIVVFDESIRD